MYMLVKNCIRSPITSANWPGMAFTLSMRACVARNWCVTCNPAMINGPP